MKHETSRVALVTGSGRRRVGSHVAGRLGARGYRVAIHYRTAEAEANEAIESLRRASVEAEAFRADLGVEAEARGLVDAVVDRFGRIDVLVNCAAIWEPKPLEEVTARDVLDHFEANVLGTFVCSQQAGLAMVRQAEGGVIVTVGDWAEARPYPGYSAYFASKGAIPTLTRCLAVELGRRNPKVRVNGILPGPVMLPDGMPDEEKQRIINSTLVRREGRPGNVADAVLALVENDFLTGVCLPVDGGRTIFAPGDEPTFRQDA